MSDDQSFEEFDEESPIRRLIARWRGEAEVLRRHNCLRQAVHLVRLAAEVEEAFEAHQQQALPVPEVAPRTGYTEKHLRALVRQGELIAHRPNGDRGKILIPRFAWPRKPVGASEEVPSSRTGPRDPAPGEESPADRAFRKARGRGG